MNPDGIAYLDMAAEALRHGPSSLINPLWSPGLPALLAAGLAIFQPSPASLFPFAHLVTFLTFCLALSGFACFLKAWIASPHPGHSHAPDSVQTPIAFAVFLWISIEFIGLRTIAPDLLMAATALFVIGICCRIYSGAQSNCLLASFGVLLGLGYYAKAPMFPMGILLLVLVFIWPPEGFRRRRLLLPAFTFLLVSAPLIAFMSAKVGRFSLGESGRLNYIWHVNGLKPVGWTRAPNLAFGTPIHPPRKLLDNPEVLEFAAPIQGTYPLWHDPAHWYAGAKPRFSLSGQINALKTAVQVYWWSAQMQTILIGGAIALLVLTGLRRALHWPGRLTAVLICWAAASALLFALVHAEYRYIAAFIVPAWIALYRHLGSGLAAQTRRAVHLVVALVLLIHMAAGLPKLAAAALSISRGVPAPPYIQAAGGLIAAGVRPGDPLATIGPAYDAYFARYLGSRIVAQVTLNEKEPAPTPADWLRIRQSLAAAGVKALISRRTPPGAVHGDWKPLPPDGPNSYSVMLIPSPDALTR